MDWLPEERAERNEDCTLEPWQPDPELDLTGEKYIKPKVPKLRKATKPFTISRYFQGTGKHPVSILVEYCSKRKCGTPKFELCFESGPDHKKNFLFKVTVNKVEYKPTVSSGNKKMAKALAAQTCLQALGILPKPDSKTVKKP